MANNKKKLVKRMKETNKTRNFKNGTKVQVISLSMRYLDAEGYKIDLKAIIGGDYASIVGSLDTQALVTGKKPVRIVTRKDDRTPDYFIANNVYEFHLLKENAPCLYAIIVGWRNTIVGKIDDGSFDIRKNGVVFVPHKQRPYDDSELTDSIVWKHSYEDGEEKEFSNQLTEQYYAQKREGNSDTEILISPWLYAYLHTFGLERSIVYMYQYANDELSDLYGEIEFYINSYNNQIKDESKHIETWGEFFSKALIEKWGYKFTKFVRVRIPGVDSTYLYYDFDSEEVRIGYIPEEDLDLAIIPIDMVPEELRFLAIDHSEDVDEEAALEQMKMDWEERMQKIQAS